MNTYTTEFTAKCPVNGAPIVYTLEIKTASTIPVESILSVCAAFTEGFHEPFADSLARTFGGLQTLEADHHGVRIKTHRSGAAKVFTLR